MALGSGRCHYHPDRPGLGICVECRNVICTECTTQFEGINRCASCLQARLQKLKTLLDRNDWSVGNLVTALLAAVVLFGSFYALAAVIRH